MMCSALLRRTRFSFFPPLVNLTADSISRVIGLGGLRGSMLPIFTFVWVAAAGIAAEKKPHALDLTKLPAASSEAVDYVKDIQPILSKHCYSCHGPEKQKSGLRLDRKVDALAGGDTGK